jgi:hypothetical protein
MLRSKTTSSDLWKISNEVSGCFSLEPLRWKPCLLQGGRVDLILSMDGSIFICQQPLAVVSSPLGSESSVDPFKGADSTEVYGLPIAMKRSWAEERTRTVSE